MTYPLTEEPYRVPEPGEAAAPVLTPGELKERTARRKAVGTKANRAKVNRERWGILNAFTNTMLSQAGPAGCAVWLVLFQFARPDGTAFASLSVLEGKTGISRKTIQRAVSRLSELGAVEMVQRGGGAVASVYRLRGGGQK